MASKSRTSTKPKGKADVATLLGAIGTKKTAKTASKTPEVLVTDETQLRQIAAIIEAKGEQKQAESALDIAQGAFRDTACDLFETRCRQDGTLHSSIKLLGKENGSPLRLSYTQPRTTTKLKEGEVNDPLHSIFGKDFGRLFEPKRTIEIDTAKMTDGQIVAVVESLQKALDPKNEDNGVFDDVVKVESLILAQEAFFTGRVLDDKIRKLADRAHDDGHCKMKAASFKV